MDRGDQLANAALEQPLPRRPAGNVAGAQRRPEPLADWPVVARIGQAVVLGEMLRSAAPWHRLPQSAPAAGADHRVLREDVEAGRNASSSRRMLSSLQRRDTARSVVGRGRQRARARVDLRLVLPAASVARTVLS
jgi:hypothetical protein